MTEVRCARFAELTPLTLYRILRLREAVFAVEQECVYTDLDGRDHEPETVHFWVDAEEGARSVTACARLLTQPDGARKLGRVVTAAEARGQGLAGAIMDAALELVPSGTPTVLDAQVRLAAWYGRWGFTRAGEDFDEAGLLHTPMRRA